MEPAELGVAKGLVVDSSVLVMAERGELTTPEIIRNPREAAGDVPIVICALTVAELGHGIYHTMTAAKAQTAAQVSRRAEAARSDSSDHGGHGGDRRPRRWRAGG